MIRESSRLPFPVAGIVLSAGASSRLGRSKALVPWQGRPLALAQIELLQGCGLRPVILVLGYDRERISASLGELPQGAIIVENPRYQDGQFSSLQCGLRAGTLLSGAFPAWTAVLPVDTVGVGANVVSHLVHRTAEADPRVEAIVPTHVGQRGHPVLLSMRFVLQALAEDARTSRLDHLLRNTVVEEVEVDCAEIHANLNTPSDLHLLRVFKA